MNSPKIPTRKTPAVKLNDAHRKFIVELLGKLMSASEIVDKFEETFGIPITINIVFGYKKSMKWSGDLVRARDKYLNDLGEVPIFHPKIRFERYEKLYNMALDKKDIKGMHDALSLTQTEFGKKVGGDTYNQVFMTQNTVTMSMEEIKARKDKLLNRLQELNPVLETEVNSGPDR